MNQENGTKHISFKPISVNCHERTRSGADTFTLIYLVLDCGLWLIPMLILLHRRWRERHGAGS